MKPDDPIEQPSLEDDLLAWGKVVVIETRGRSSGKARRVAVGFIEVEHGAVLVAAAEDSTDWARNLISDPRCRVERDGLVSWCQAIRLEGEERRHTIAQLILKYGTPAERQGGGPAFRLEPAAQPDRD